ncbi:MAG: alpha/beta fold hydrolase, partial [Vitreoscilla sp.]
MFTLQFPRLVSAARLLAGARAAAVSIGAALSLGLSLPASAQAPQSKFADVNCVRLHYLVAGSGDPIILVHGYAETSHMWLPLIKELQKNHL